jgi:hypothetical protein
MRSVRHRQSFALRAESLTEMRIAGRNPMKQLALVVIIVMAGCATTNNTQTAGVDPKIASLEEERQTIAGREQQCMDNALARSRDEMARVTATSDASVELLMQRAQNERDRELSECRAKADSENAEISARERDEYALQAQQERAGASLMGILLSTRPR